MWSLINLIKDALMFKRKAQREGIVLKCKEGHSSREGFLLNCKMTQTCLLKGAAWELSKVMEYMYAENQKIAKLLFILSMTEKLQQ